MTARKATKKRNAGGIRDYGPGKFFTILDSYIWQASLDGILDDEIGESETSGWFGFMKNDADTQREIIEAAKDGGEPLTQAELARLRRSAAFIMNENSQGFVFIQEYRTLADAERNWERIVEEHEAEIEDEEEEDF